MEDPVHVTLNTSASAMSPCVDITGPNMGHLWAGRRRPHNNYVIGNPADTTPIVHSAWAQRFPAPPAADPTGTAGHRAEPQRSCLATTPSRRAGCRPLWGNCKPSAGHGGAVWFYANRHHRLQTFQGTRALVEPRELRAGASTSRRYGPRTRMEPRAVRAGGEARLRRRVTRVEP